MQAQSKGKPEAPAGCSIPFFDFLGDAVEDDGGVLGTRIHRKDGKFIAP
jgi:hypothetical protein